MEKHMIWNYTYCLHLNQPNTIIYFPKGFITLWILRTESVLCPYFNRYWNTKHSIRSISETWKTEMIRKVNYKYQVGWPAPKH